MTVETIEGGSRGDRPHSDDHGQPALLIAIASLSFIRTGTFPLRFLATVMVLGGLVLALLITVAAAGRRTTALAAWTPR